MKLNRIGLLGVVATLMLAACGGDDDTPTRVPPTATAVPGATSTPTPVTPPSGPRGTLTVIEVLGSQLWVQRLAGTDYPLHYIIEGLLRKDPETLNTIPNVAEEWNTTLNSDGTVDWYFRLREGIQYHKGWGEVVASDVKFSAVQHMKEGSIASNSSSIVKWFGGDPDNIEVLSKYEFVVHAEKANALVMKDLSLISQATVTPLSQKHMEQVGEDGYNNDPVGTGPWEFVSQVRGQFDKLEAFTENFRKVPDFAEMVILDIPEAATAIAMIRTSAADIVRFPNKLRDEVAAGGVKIVRNPISSETYAAFGGMHLPTRPGYDSTVPWVGEIPTNDRPRMVRQALNLAVDKQAIIDKVLLGEATPSSVTFSFIPGAGYFSPDWKPYPYDPQKAKELLAQAGYPDGFEMNFWSITIWNVDVATAVIGYLEDIGIKVNNEVIEYRPTVRTALVERNTAGFMYNWDNSRVTDPITYGGGVGGPSWSTILHTESEFQDRFYAQIFEELDEAKRNQLIRQLGDEYYRQYWTIPISLTSALFAVSDNVQEWAPFPSDTRVSNTEFAVPAS